MKQRGWIIVFVLALFLSAGCNKNPEPTLWEGDILVYYPVLDMALELSSMGIRVDEETMLRQLEAAGCTERAALPFHSSLLRGELPYSVGGGIGQSRMCMFFLRKAHIGEVQCSSWPRETYRICAENGIPLL